MYQIIQDLTTNKVSRPFQPLTPIGITLHSTATPGATSENMRRYFQTEKDRNASAHAGVDWDSIVQMIPWNEKAWHAGGTANSKFIGIELCEPKGINQVQFNEVWKRGVWLFAYLFVNVLKIKTVTKENLISHAEVSAKWHETDHTDPVGYFKSYGKTVDQFRAEVQSEINKMITPVAPPIPAPPAYPGMCIRFNAKAVIPAVKTIQKRLNELGYNCGVADGVFGNKTLTAVKAFQSLKNITVDGIVGPATWAKLFN